MSVSAILISAPVEYYLIALLIVLLTVIYFKNAFKYKNLPPGPIGLPILGYLPFISIEPHVTFKQISEKYGNVFSIYMGGKLAVVCNEYKSIKEVTSNDAFLNRPVEGNIFAKFPSLGLSVAGHNGEIWREDRRFMLQALRDMGVGKHSMELFVQESIEELNEMLKKKNGKPVDIRDLSYKNASSVIWTKAFGERVSLDDPENAAIARHTENIINRANFFTYQLYFPLLRKFNEWAKFGNQGFVFSEEKKMGNVIDKKIKEHEATFEENYSRDYIDMYLNEMKKQTSNRKFFSSNYLRGDIGVLFFGGADTISNSLTWQLLLMAGHPKVQERIYKEISEVVGKERPVSISDRKDLPYTAATILEQQRFITLAPVSFFRRAIVDTTIQGYTVPKDTIVFLNLYAMHNDTDYWKDPELFQPERFLESNGKLRSKVESYGPFSMGKRACPGENLANFSMFLYFTNVIQKFQVLPPEGMKVDYTRLAGAPATIAQMRELRFLPR